MKAAPENQSPVIRLLMNTQSENSACTSTENLTVESLALHVALRHNLRENELFGITIPKLEPELRATCIRRPL